MILFGGSYNTDAIDTRYTMLKSVVEDNRKIMVTQILVDPFEKVIPFRLVNMEDHPVQLNLKMNINLTDEPVRIPDEWNSTIRNCKAENSWKMNDKCRNEAEIPALPDHLKDLLKLDRVQQRNVTQSSDGNCSSWLINTQKRDEYIQKEDPDYSFLHIWMNAGETPDRDKCASFSPAVRHYC
ncbi:Hypothetical predicted protein [Mytilus galloprovincialis]|uniref:Uncharacterized protein n=1 Tax=Mytilus galloprovincialis TaxID=29158 RepID=A0A8B6G005_MYTGA|nr:Hypothetical predicted protein [Mytilus galloprovincialis]